MRVIRSKHAGACYGVQRALDMAQVAVMDGGDAHTLGPLIHNPKVVSELEASGVRVAESVDDITSGVVIIRSHGVTAEVHEALDQRGLSVIDATCPHVARAQQAAEELAREGRFVVVVGEAGHPEVEGLVSWARRAGGSGGCANAQMPTGGERTGDVGGRPDRRLEEHAGDMTGFVGDSRAQAGNGGNDACAKGAGCGTVRVAVVSSPGDLPVDIAGPVGIVVQTTQTRGALDAVVTALRERGIEPEVRNTICFATRQRQEAAAKLAEQVDAVVVIGGRNSSNTTRLAEICADICGNTHHIESADELDPAWFTGCETVGVTAGASTPEPHIHAVEEALGLL